MRRSSACCLLLVALAACSAPKGEAAKLDARATSLLAELPPSYRRADVAQGKLVFNQCRACHTAIEGGAVLVGPNLYGVWGAKAAQRAGFPYSDALKATGWTWDAPTLDRWLTDPRTAVPGTKMSFVGVSDPAARRDVIAYLRLASVGAAP